MSSKDTNTYWIHNDNSVPDTQWNHQHYNYTNIELQDLNLAKYEQNSNQFTVECEQCQSPCSLQDKSPPTWICNKCNIRIQYTTFSYVYNNIDTQKQKQSISLNDSVSTVTEKIECVITASDFPSTNNPSNTSSIDKNYRPNHRHNYNVSRSITLNFCDIDSTSTSTDTTSFHSNNDKLKLKQNDTTDSEYMLYRHYQNMNTSQPSINLENFTMSTVTTTDSTTATQPYSPNIEKASHIQNHLQKEPVKITRRTTYKLEALSELSELEYYKNKNENENILDSMEEAFDECIQQAYLKGFTQGYSTGVRLQLSPPFPLQPSL